MGIYCMKITKHTVNLANGEVASVAIYAYKPTSGFSGPSNGQMHTRSGAGACDRAAEAGKREPWVVLGCFNDATGRIEVDVDGMAKRMGVRGSFYDGDFDAAAVDQAYIEPVGSSVIDFQRSRQTRSGGFGLTMVETFDRKSGDWVETSRHPFRYY